MMRALLDKLPESRPADWGWNVSVCIAMMCENQRRIVCVTDQRVSFGSFSGEAMAWKNYPISYDWTALCAGNDVEHADPILQLARPLLKGAMRKHQRQLSGREVADIFDSAYSEHLQAHIESKYLRKHGFDTDSFQRIGKLKCTPEVYAKTWDKVEKEKFSLQFLLCGLTPEPNGEQRAHIWCVDGENAPRCYDSVGCWAIGKGANAALSTLAFYISHRDLSPMSDQPTVSLAAVTAKFMAEKASDVGTSTFVTIIQPNCRGNLQFISGYGIERMRKEWLKRGAPRLPKSSIELTKKLFYGNMETIEEMEAALGAPGKLTRVIKRSQAKKAASTPSTSQTSTDQQ